MELGDFIVFFGGQVWAILGDFKCFSENPCSEWKSLMADFRRRNTHGLETTEAGYSGSPQAMGPIKPWLTDGETMVQHGYRIVRKW